MINEIPKPGAHLSSTHARFDLISFHMENRPSPPHPSAIQVLTPASHKSNCFDKRVLVSLDMQNRVFGKCTAEETNHVGHRCFSIIMARTQRHRSRFTINSIIAIMYSTIDAIRRFSAGRSDHPFDFRHRAAFAFSHHNHTQESLQYFLLPILQR